MKKLKEKIVKEGKTIGETILKVDSFLNHQVDVELMQEIGKKFAEHFRDKNITKVVTIESSGIAPATMVAMQLKVPLLFLKKQKPNTLQDEFLQTTVYSFTKERFYELMVAKKYVEKEDRVLIIDDFLANGEAGLGAIRLMEEAGAKVVGVGIVIEKAFQPGRSKIEEKGYEVYSLARIKRIEEGHIEFVEEN